MVSSYGDCDAHDTRVSLTQADPQCLVDTHNSHLQEQQQLPWVLQPCLTTNSLQRCMAFAMHVCIYNWRDGRKDVIAHGDASMRGLVGRHRDTPDASGMLLQLHHTHATGIATFLPGTRWPLEL